MSISNIFTSEVAVKVFYAYLAVSLGNTGVETAQRLKPDVVAEKVASVEKRLDRMETLIIEAIKKH